MEPQNNTLTVSIHADVEPFRAAMQNLNKISQSFGNTITSSLSKAIIHGKSFENTLRTIAMRISNMALSRGLAPLDKLLGNAIGSITNSLIPVKPFAKGGVLGADSVIANLRSSSIVKQPTFFNATDKLGVMGEKGPEAIMPLARSADGSLGIKTSQAVPGNIIFNVTANDAASFQRSESQISAMLARAVNRGKRSI